MNKQIKILTVFGTRPEAIKLAPFIKAAESDPDCVNIVCVSTQHRELQNEVLKLFDIKSDYDLNVMTHNQDLFHVTQNVLAGIKNVLLKEFPDYVVVQGDTTTAFAAALGAFYCKIPVVHIEAGLRTGNISSPFPEEANRTLISRIASLHMAPTREAVDNLKREGITRNVYAVGNTIVDAIDLVLKSNSANKELLKHAANKIILVTVHRRENFGDNLVAICNAISKLALKHKDITFIWPVHPNPNIKDFVLKRMSAHNNIELLEPLSYTDLIYLINKSALIISDSGGIQEEACILAKPIVVLRDTTERPEVIDNGLGVLVGADEKKIISHVSQLLKEKTLNGAKNHIYGLPGISNKIISLIKKHSNSC